MSALRPTVQRVNEFHDWRMDTPEEVAQDGLTLAWVVSWQDIHTGDHRYFVYSHAESLADRRSLIERPSAGSARAWIGQHRPELIADLRKRELWPALGGSKKVWIPYNDGGPPHPGKPTGYWA